MDTSNENEKKFNKMSQGDMPRFPLKEAITIAETLRDNFASQDASPIDLAKSVGRSPTSSSWRFLTGAAVAYGLTTAAYNATSIALTPLGDQIVNPTEEGADKEGLMTALIRPTILKAFYEKYDGSKFPNIDIAKNVLRQLGVPHDRTEEAVKIVIENAKYTGIMTEVGGNQFIQLRSLGRNRTSETPSTVNSIQNYLPSSRGDEYNAKSAVGMSPVSLAEGRVVLMIPSNLKEKVLDDETIEEDWRKVRNAVKDFANKYIPQESSKDDYPSSMDTNTDSG